MQGRVGERLAAEGHKWREAAPWLLLALAPAIFALTTWNYAHPDNAVQSWIRLSGAPIAVFELLFILAAVARGSRPAAAVREAPAWVQGALLLLVAIAIGTGLLVASDRGAALLRALLMIIHLLFALSVAAEAARSPAPVRRLVWPAAVLGLLGFVVILAIYVAAIPDPSRFNWLRFWLGGSNVRQLGFYACVGAAAAIGLSATAAGRRQSFAYGAAAAVFFALAFWSGTRGALVAAGAAVLIAMIRFRALRSLRAWSILIASGVLGLLLSRLHRVPDRHFGFVRMEAQPGGGELGGLGSGRLSVWRKTWEAVQDRPFFGHGQGQFRQLSHESLWTTYNHPHNVMLQALFDWGFLGTACLAGLAWFVALRCWRATKRPNDQQLPAFLVAAALLTMSLYEGSAFHTYPLMMIALSLGWVLGTASAPRPD